MFTLIYRRDFEAAHCLPNYDGKCQNLHGHNYKLEMELCSSSTDQNGMLIVNDIVIDFDFIKEKSNEVLPDHKTLNDWMEEPPSTENVARELFWRLKAVGLPVSAVTLWETERGRVRYVPSFEELRMEKSADATITRFTEGVLLNEK